MGAEHHRYSFGRFILDIERGALQKDGADILLRPKCFAVLTYLVKHHGVLLTKDELMTAVWPNQAVTEDSLTQCLIQIRKALVLQQFIWCIKSYFIFYFGSYFFHFLR